ncbi:hypothetical protein MUN82_18955 [Hymenobacter aerilatus]|uniref:Uncharacterized protein n=1 Tax=Hymenobacter aerilatus TaxID=2932251 RepID=A0A8T9SWB6_9BACT|nr:hypothetical protein [Hymenobacter aerilatus]UOR05003.1 hypothetical protein MUN82_18955 [Hymenobacter aerilatus]
MSEGQYVTYRRFNSLNEALVLCEFFDKENVKYKLEDYSLAFDPTFANNEQNKEFRIKLKKQDFEAANVLQENMYSSVVDSVDESHYLFTFTNQELYEVITKSDEWSKLDYLLAQKILSNRGELVNDALIQSLKEIRMNELAKPEESSMSWIFIGYIFALAGGFIGLFIGWHLFHHKKTLPNGERIYGYVPSNRKQGIIIIVISILSFIGWTVLKFRNSDNF